MFSLKAFLTWIVAILIATAAVAQPTPEQSRAQAEQALKLLLEEGDRPGALRAALRGLPADAEAADLSRFPEAMSALARAYGNRSLTVGWQDETFALLSPDGRRALLAPGVSNPITPNALPTVHVIDPESGRQIGAPIVSTRPMEGGMIGHAGLAMAPKAGLFAVNFQAEGRVHIHRLEDGQRVGSVPAQPWQMVFSPDGRYLATSRPEGLSNQPWPLEVWDVASGARIMGVLVPPIHFFDWASDDTVLLGYAEGDFSGPMTWSMVRLGLGGNQVALPTPGVAPGMVMVSPDQAHFMIASEAGVAVFDMSGRRMMEVPSLDGGAHFVREGQAVAIIRFDEGERLASLAVDVYALDGTALEPRPSDYMGFEAFVRSSAGDVIGAMALLSQRDGVWEGAGLPEGMALVQAAMELVGRPEASPLPSVDTVEQRSEAFALEAERHLGIGDRIGAIVAALKGLPDDPDEADFDTYEAAYLLLYRAVAARVLRVPIDRPVAAMVDPTGTRLVHAGAEPALYDMPGGALIAPLLRANASVYASETQPFFDPSGLLVAVAEDRLPILHFYDARTGQGVRSITFPITSLSDYNGYSTILRPSGFSHDGNAFAVSTRDAIFVVNIADWSVQSLQPPGRHAGLISWLPGRSLLLVDHVYSNGPGPVAHVYIHNGIEPVLLRTILSDPGGLRSAPLSMVPNRQGTALLAEEGDSLDWRVVVYDAVGQVRALTVGHDSGVQFVRDGTAIVYREPRGTVTERLKVVSLIGASLTPELQDHVVLDQAVINSRGDPATWGVMPASAPRYRGADVPTRRALWDFAMAEVGTTRWPEIAAERIDPQ